MTESAWHKLQCAVKFNEGAVPTAEGIAASLGEAGFVSIDDLTLTPAWPEQPAVIEAEAMRQNP